MKRASSKRVAMKSLKQAGVLKAPSRAEKEILDWVLSVRAATIHQEMSKKFKIALRNKKNIDRAKKALRSTNHKLAYQMYLRVARGTKDLVYTEVRNIKKFSIEDFEGLNHPLNRNDFLEDVCGELEKALLINENFLEDFEDLERRLSPHVKSIDIGGWATREFEFDLTKEKGWYFSEDQLRSLDGGKVKIMVEIFPLEKGRLGSWSGHSNTMHLTSEFVTDLSIPKEAIQGTIRHELMHFTQTHGEKILSLNRRFGLPSRNISTPEYDQHKDLSHHKLDDVEFFPVLESSYPKLKKILRKAKTEREKMELFKEAVGASKITWHTLFYFKELKSKSLPKWKRAVSEAYIEVM